MSSESVLQYVAPPPDDTRSYSPVTRSSAVSSAADSTSAPDAADPAHVYDVRFARPREAGESPLGTVLVVHGGFWRAAYDRTHAGAQAEGLADAGWNVAVGEYRRAGMPGGGWPGTFEDLTALVAAVRADPDLPGPLWLMGHSAGGHLVTWAAGQPWAQGLAGVVSLAGVLDLAGCDRLHLSADAARDFLGGPPSERPEAWASADPMNALPPLVPVRMVHGDADDNVPAELSESYLAAASAAGGEVSLDVVQGAAHFDVIDPASTAWPRVLAALR